MTAALLKRNAWRLPQSLRVPYPPSDDGGPIEAQKALSLRLGGP